MAKDYAPAALVRAGKEADKEIPGCVFSGVLGDSAHTYGYHRGRCVLRSTDYSVKLTLDKVGAACAASALDLSFTAAQMKVVTKRLRDSALDPDDPRMEPVREFYGTLTGNAVFGLIKDTLGGPWRGSTSDKSHLWHVHISFFRKFNENYPAARGVVDVMLGKAYKKPAVPKPPVAPPKPPVTPPKPPVADPKPPTPPPTIPPTVEVHRVGKGETLSGIAAKHKLKWQDLAKWNNITDPNKIKVGDEIRLKPPAVSPPAEKKPVTPPPAPKPPAAPKPPPPKPPAPKPPAKTVLPPWSKGPNDAFHPYLDSKPPNYPSIALVQRRLKELGYNVGTIDGRYGPATLAAVKKFQRDNGLVADGLIGPKTWNKLRSK